MLQTREKKLVSDRTATRDNDVRNKFDFSPWTNLPPLVLVGSTQIGTGVYEPRPGFLERTLALLLLLMVAPVVALAAAAIKVDSPGGPVFYQQERVGLDRRRRRKSKKRWTGKRDRRKTPGSGRGFMVWKLRSMVPDAESKTGPVWASANDSRITRVGRVLRYTRLDEVPQLINVVRGEMRIIGPRPERPYFVNSNAQNVPEYANRHSIPPGITGLAQVERAYDASVDDVRKKIGYDLFYVENRCLLLDLKILVKTVDVVVRGRGHH